MAGDDGEGAGKRNAYLLLIGIQTGTVTMETSMEIPQKTRKRTNMTSYNSPRDLPKGL